MTSENWIGQFCDHRDMGLGYRKTWGYAALVQFHGRRILFDTGGSAEDYPHNLNLFADRHDVDLAKPKPELLVISHLHGDHTNGLPGAAEMFPGLKTYVPPALPGSDMTVPDLKNLDIEVISESVKIDDKLFLIATRSSGKYNLLELSLAIKTSLGLVVVVGCSHPAVTSIIRAAMDFTATAAVHLVTGGFHLQYDENTTDDDVAKVGRELLDLGVERVGLTHCTAEEAAAVIIDVMGADKTFETRLDSVVEFDG